MDFSPVSSTNAAFSHQLVRSDGTDIHYVSAGTAGSPILLVHGFPETWWAFHKLLPLLAEHHRVFAVDLRGFGGSRGAMQDYDSRAVAEDLHRLVAHLDVGPVHLSGQDIAGAGVFRLAATYPEQVASFTGIEMGLAGFGLEALADVTLHPGSWHIGVLAAPKIPQLLLAGREEAFLRFMFSSMSAAAEAVSDADLAEFARSYSRPGAWEGAAKLYRSMLREGADIRAIAQDKALTMPVLAVGAGGGEFTATTMAKVSAGTVRSVLLDGVGHYPALEAPERLAQAMLAFVAEVDASRGDIASAHS
ncbi:alpha/beta hydrolase [Devosia sp. 1566]|uniref:alpha/beta fold hydrolase n=1 Tax=Devosia sp. 1566 TaxID=2499144 RepID=UPI000FD9CEA7|nr:alpha/beta hydrolase [Devosia sp. 1566]